MENETNETKKQEEIKEDVPDIHKGVGDKEPQKLKPGMVQIKSVEIENITKDSKIVGKKVVCMCKHPDKDELVNISSAKHIIGKNIKAAGLWFNVDQDNKIAKNSILASLLKKTKSENVSQLTGKEVETEQDDSGFLCFKAY